MKAMEEMLGNHGLLPLAVPAGAEDALATGRALLQAGLPLLEIPLARPEMVDMVRLLRRELPELVVGAGTVLEPATFGLLRDAGAAFAVSPGFHPALADAARESGLPWMPGVFTPGEILVARARGYHLQKVYPAAGQQAMLRACAVPFPDVRFCVTGGMEARSLSGWLALPNVLAVGGRFITADPAAISTHRQTAAAALSGRSRTMEE